MTTTNNTKKMTKRDYFNTLLTYAEVKANPDMVKFVEHEIELLNNRNTGERKPTAQQTANESIKTVIHNLLHENHNKLFTITDMQKECAELGELSNQRISAIVNQMAKAENATVEKIVDKRKTYFKAVQGE